MQTFFFVIDRPVPHDKCTLEVHNLYLKNDQLIVLARLKTAAFSIFLNQYVIRATVMLSSELDLTKLKFKKIIANTDHELAFYQSKYQHENCCYDHREEKNDQKREICLINQFQVPILTETLLKQEIQQENKILKSETIPVFFDLATDSHLEDDQGNKNLLSNKRQNSSFSSKRCTIQ